MGHCNFRWGQDVSVFVRFYVKFSSGYHYNRHFVWLLANQASNKWAAFSSAVKTHSLAKSTCIATFSI